MAVEAVRCPHCQSEAVGKYGKASNGKERFRCQQRERCGWTVICAYGYSGCTPEVKRQRVEMTLKGSGIRDMARVLQVGPNPGIKELKKSVQPFTGAYKRRRGGVSRGAHSRSAARGSRGGR